ncbi:MAG: ABC transporter permease [Terracidiphilus sp.]|jgi:predicted permease
MRVRSLITGIVSRPRSWIRAVSQRDQLEAEMEAELAHHLENLTADLLRAGHSPAEASRRARIALGAVTVHKEGMRASLGLRWWDEFWADLRYGLRILRKSLGFTFIAATSLALAIGANTAIFSIAKSLLYDRLGVPHPEQLRLLSWHGNGNQAVHGMWGQFDPAPDGGMAGNIFSYPVYNELREQNRSLQDLIAFKNDGMNATIAGQAQRVQAEMVSGNYYACLGVRPQLGRAIQPSDERHFGAGTVAVISDGVWERAFGRSPAVLGQTITLNQAVMTIVGVNPRGFTGAKGAQVSPEIFVPITMLPVIDPKGKTSLLEDPDFWWVNMMGRARPGVGDAQAEAVLRAQLEADVRATMQVKPGETIPTLELTDGSRGLHWAEEMFRKPVSVLMALAGFVLLLACANIANLLLARGAHRQRELSVRLALGAGRGRVLRQLLTESLLLATIGGVGGLLLGYAGRNLLPTLMSNAWERNEFAVRFDWGIFAFAAAVTLLTGLLFGLAPAWLAARAEVSSGLKESAQTATRRRGLAGKFLVAFQIALSTLLVVGAGLFLRTVFALNAVEVGFRTDHLILLEVNPPARRYSGGKDVELYARLEQGFAGLPGVEAVTAVTIPYISESMSNDFFLPEGEKQDDTKDQAEFFNVVGNGFFGTMGIPMIAGRPFDAQDTASSQRVVVINERLARKRFPNENPIGKMVKIGLGVDNSARIVGICRNTRYANLRDDAPSQFFASYRQQQQVGAITFLIRTRLKPAALMSSFRDVAQKQDRDLPIIDIRTQQEQIDATTQTERVFAALTSGFGLLALVLACVGIYGIMAYSVANRRNEIGIRLALGAQPGQVRGMILRESGWLAIAGIVAGVAAALALTRLVKSMLYGIQPYDPPTLVGGVLILLAVALAASWIPARRAAGVQPMEALRHE